ncbi:MAG: 30S ribosome-binding factor RbfA [Candidatus Alcyoniella australis]|nr:30S ribosome-binding factor RbfA [Candidatus Alcyoniella australis]
MNSEPPYSRAQRVGDQIQREIGDLLLRGEIKDPRIGRGFATVTRVSLTKDLRIAKVYVSVIGSEQACVDTIKGLQSAAGYIQREMGRRLRLKYTPEIRILHDDSFAKAAQINKLLDEVSEEGKA